MSCKNCKRRLILLQHYEIELREIAEALRKIPGAPVISRLEQLQQETAGLVKQINESIAKPPRPKIEADDFEPLHFGVSGSLIDSD